MFLSSFENLRRSILDTQHIDSLLHLGPRTFDELSGEVVQNAAFVITKSDGKNSGTYYRLVDGRNCADKERLFFHAEELRGVYYPNVEQENFEKIPGCQLGFWLKSIIIDLFEKESFQDSSFAIVKGIFTGNNSYFLKLWYEVSSLSINNEWKKYAKAGGSLRWYGLDSYVVRWHNEGKELKEFEGAGLGASKYYGKHHFVWSGLTTSAISFRMEPDDVWFDDVSPAVIFNSDSDIQLQNYMIGFGNSCIARYLLKLFNPTLHYQISDIKKLPLLRCHSEKTDIISSTVSENIAISKSDWDAHETSWDFEANPLVAICNNFKNEGCSSTSYRIENIVKEFETRWEALFNELHSNEEELNRLFIEIYGLQDELTPDVPKDEITILQQGEISIDDNQVVWHPNVVMKQLISYAIGCMMGRYSDSSLPTKVMVWSNTMNKSHTAALSRTMTASFH